MSELAKNTKAELRRAYRAAVEVGSLAVITEPDTNLDPESHNVLRHHPETPSQPRSAEVLFSSVAVRR